MANAKYDAGDYKHKAGGGVSSVAVKSAPGRGSVGKIDTNADRAAAKTQNYNLRDYGDRGHAKNKASRST